MTQLFMIIGLAGQKQAGKTTASAYLKDILDDIIYEYSFADTLKTFCIDVLGLTRKQCGYDDGTDEDKNSLTRYKWEDVDAFFREKYGGRNSNSGYHRSIPVPKTGFMTAREVMQVQGEMQRRFFCGTIWLDPVFSKIETNTKMLQKSFDARDGVHVITDIRHKNEVERTLAEGGYILYFSRKTNNDNADSERELLSIPWTSYSRVYEVANQGLSIEAKNAIIKETVSFFEGISPR